VDDDERCRHYNRRGNETKREVEVSPNGRSGCEGCERQCGRQRDLINQQRLLPFEPLRDRIQRPSNCCEDGTADKMGVAVISSGSETESAGVTLNGRCCGNDGGTGTENEPTCVSLGICCDDGDHDGEWGHSKLRVA